MSLQLELDGKNEECRGLRAQLERGGQTSPLGGTGALGDGMGAAPSPMPTLRLSSRGNTPSAATPQRSQEKEFLEGEVLNYKLQLERRMEGEIRNKDAEIRKLRLILEGNTTPTRQVASPLGDMESFRLREQVRELERRLGDAESDLRLERQSAEMREELQGQQGVRHEEAMVRLKETLEAANTREVARLNALLDEAQSGRASLY